MDAQAGADTPGWLHHPATRFEQASTDVSGKKMSHMNQTTRDLLAELQDVRAAYQAFWGAHSSDDIERLGRRPRAVETPVADRLEALEKRSADYS